MIVPQIEIQALSSNDSFPVSQGQNLLKKEGGGGGGREDDFSEEINYVVFVKQNMINSG